MDSKEKQSVFDQNNTKDHGHPLKRAKCCTRTVIMWVLSAILLAAGVAIVCVVLLSGKNYKTAFWVDTFHLKVINMVKEKQEVNYMIELQGEDANLYNILHAYQNVSEATFRFSTSEEEKDVQLISVNGLAQDDPTGHWVLAMKVNKTCTVAVGLHTHIPSSGDQIILAYISKAMAGDFFSCSRNDSLIKISIQDWTKSSTFSNVSYVTPLRSNSTLLDLMDHLKYRHKGFRYTVAPFSGHSHMITTINGLEQNSTTGTYWAIGILVEGKLCLIPVGASTYYPNSGEHIVLAYFTLAMFRTYPTCGKENMSRIEISVRNYVGNIAFENSTYWIESDAHALLIDFMRNFQDTNSDFRYTTVEYSGLGESITSVNGLEQNSTLGTYWALAKRTGREMCLLPVGASSYYPEDGEDIVLAYFTLAMFSMYPTCGKENISVIEISVHNYVGNIAFENISYTAESQTHTTLIEIMRGLRETNSDFIYTTIEYSGLGESISSVNGLEKNSTSGTYWGLGKVVGSEMCLLPVGASSYYPEDGEHIVLAYLTLAMFRMYPTCGKENISTIEISVHNYVGNIAFENNSYSAERNTHDTLIVVMRDLQDTNGNFRYSSVAYSGLGEMITAVNGLEQNSTSETFWALGKRTEGNMCLLPVGVSSYYPKEGEHIVLAYFTLAMFRMYPTCGKENISTIEISVHNYVENIAFENNSYSVESNTHNTLIGAIRELQETNSNFQYTTVQYAGLGESVTSVNGLEQNSTAGTYWALGKIIGDDMCLLPVGASSYYPQDGEHIILAYFTLAMFKVYPTCGKENISTVHVSIHNFVGSIAFENSSYSVDSNKHATLLDAMSELQNTNNRFRYTTVTYSGLGESITSVNGLEQNSTSGTYWALGKINGGEMCLLPVGVSSYVPEDGDHIVLAYFTLAMFRMYPTCGKENISRIEISVQNYVGNIAYENNSYSVESNVHDTLIDVMSDLQDTNSDFRYKTVEYSGLGEMITSVNGLEQNSTLETYWALGKIVGSDTCLLSMGAGSYNPQRGDHLVLAYMTYAMFNDYPSCDGGSLHDTDHIDVATVNVVAPGTFGNLYNLILTDDATLLDLLQNLNITNDDFSFTTELQLLRPVITSVNGIQQNVDLFWAVGKSEDNDEICLISVGIDVFKPTNGDNIFLMYQNSEVLSSLSYCEDAATQ